MAVCIIRVPLAPKQKHKKNHTKKHFFKKNNGITTRGVIAKGGVCGVATPPPTCQDIVGKMWENERERENKRKGKETKERKEKRREERKKKRGRRGKKGKQRKGEKEKTGDEREERERERGGGVLSA